LKTDTGSKPRYSAVSRSSDTLENDKWSHNPHQENPSQAHTNSEVPPLSPISVQYASGTTPAPNLSMTTPLSPPSTSRSTNESSSLSVSFSTQPLGQQNGLAESSTISPTHSIHPKRKPLYQHLQQEKNKFFISTLRKHSSKLFRLKQHIKRERSKWEDRLQLLSQWMQWNSSSILHSGSDSRGTPQNALKELETVIQLWIMETELMKLSNTEDRSVMLLQMDEKLNYLQSRGYSKKSILPTTLFVPSDASLQEATQNLERKEYEYDLTLALKEIFGDLLETDRLIFEKIEEPYTETLEKHTQTLSAAVDEPIVWEENQIDDWIMTVHKQQSDKTEVDTPHDGVFVTSEAYHTGEDSTQQALTAESANDMPDTQFSKALSSRTNYISPSILPPPRADPEHPQSQHYEVAQLSHTIEQQGDEIALLKKENTLASSANQSLTQQVNQLKKELQRQQSEVQRHQKLYKKARKQAEATRFQKHEMSQLEQELKFAEYKIQREKDRASDEIRSMKLEMEKIQQQLEENDKVTTFCKERLISMENNLNMDVVYTAMGTDKVVLNMEEILDSLERGDARTVVMSRVIPPKSAGTRRRSSSRGGPRQKIHSLPSASTIGSSLGEDSVLVESTVALSDFTEVPQITQAMKASMKHLVDLSRLLEITRRERDDYKKEFEKWSEQYRMFEEEQNNAAVKGIKSGVPSGIEALSRILQDVNRTSTPYQMLTGFSGNQDRSPRGGRGTSPIKGSSPGTHEDSGNAERVLRSPAPTTQGLFADDADAFANETTSKVRPRKRPSLRKNGTPIFPKRRASLLVDGASPARGVGAGGVSASGSSLPIMSRQSASPLQPLKGVGVPKFDTKSQAGPAPSFSRRKSLVSVHVPAVNSPLRRQSVQ